MDFEIPKVEYANPDDAGTLNQNRLLPWQTSIGEEVHKRLGRQVNDSEGILKTNEGVGSANDAADAMFSQNASSFSRALSSRASKAFALGRDSNAHSMSLGNVERSRLAMQRTQGNLQNLERLKKINYQGQLRFADQLADYNRDLQISKYQTLASIVGGYGSFGGMALAEYGGQKKKSKSED